MRSFQPSNYADEFSYIVAGYCFRARLMKERMKRLAQEVGEKKKQIQKKTVDSSKFPIFPVPILGFPTTSRG